MWRKLLGLCEHKWKIIRAVQLTFQGEPAGTRYELQCEHCGDIRHRDTC